MFIDCNVASWAPFDRFKPRKRVGYVSNKPGIIKIRSDGAKQCLHRKWSQKHENWPKVRENLRIERSATAFPASNVSDLPRPRCSRPEPDFTFFQWGSPQVIREHKSMIYQLSTNVYSILILHAAPWAGYGVHRDG